MGEATTAADHGNVLTLCAFKGQGCYKEIRIYTKKSIDPKTKS